METLQSSTSPRKGLPGVSTPIKTLFALQGLAPLPGNSTRGGMALEEKRLPDIFSDMSETCGLKQSEVF